MSVHTSKPCRGSPFHGSKIRGSYIRVRKMLYWVPPCLRPHFFAWLHPALLASRCCLLNVLGTFLFWEIKKIEILFIHHKIHTFKVYNSLVFSKWTRSFSQLHYLIPEHFQCAKDACTCCLRTFALAFPSAFPPDSLVLHSFTPFKSLLKCHFTRE